MKYILILLLFSSINFLALAQDTNKPIDPRLEGIDSVLNKVLKDQHVAGFSVAVVDGDQIIYSKGFGYRDVENKKPVTPNTLFAIGSTTKAFTSALLGILQKEGKLSLDGNAVSYLPQLRFFNDNMNNQITVRDLMTHRTGLSRYDLSWYIFNTSNRDSMINRVRYMEPNAGLREKWQYNNFMFLAQGMIAEKLTGKTWEQNLKERFFLPLEMKRTTASMAEFKKDTDASLPYQWEGDKIKKMDYYDLDGMGPAGSINSSANDMANWIKTWVSGGSYNGKEVLTPAYVADAVSSQMAMGGGLPRAEPDIYMESYGLGWMLSSYRGHYKVEHGGNIDGFTAKVSFFPSDRLGIVVLANQNSSAVPTNVVNIITDRLLKLKSIDWNAKMDEATKMARERNADSKKEADLKRIPNTKLSHPLVDYAGVFANPGYGEMDVSIKNDSLFLKAGKYKLWLKHYHYDVFEWKEVEKDGKVDTASSKVRLNFLANAEGKIESISATLEPDLKPTVFTMKPKVINVDPKTLEQYTGVYTLGTIEVKVSVRNKVLYVFVPGQQDYETVALGQDTFKLKALDGYNVKFEVKKEKAEIALFIQPNGTFKATRKDSK